MAEWSCIYKLDEDGLVGLFGFTGEPPDGAVKVENFVGGVSRYVHPELGSAEIPDIYPDARINKVVAAMLPSYSPPGSVPDETKAGRVERP